MPSENLNMDEITAARRKAIAESIRPMSVDELKTLGERLFPGASHPWQERFFGFINENPGAALHHATTHDGIQIVYCHAAGRGVWFQADGGMGPMRPKGLKILKEIVGGMT